MCKPLISYYIDPEKCRACMACLKTCPTGAVIGARKQVHVIDQDKCTKCGGCFDVCPSRYDAVVKLSGVPVPEPVAVGTEVTKRRGGEDE